MTNPARFTHAVQNAAVRRIIAEQLDAGADPAELAARYSISVSTTHRYAAEWRGTQRKVQRLSDFEREAIRESCRRGARKRWERTYGVRVVEAVMGEG